nr:DUF2550 domain-containing protein [Nakamurella flava]
MDVVSLAELLGLAILIALVAAVAVIAVRRSVLMRSGSVDVSWRFDLSPGGGSWVLGQALFHENQFLMYRSLSPLPGPARRLRRDQLVLGGRRAAEGTEPDLLPAGSVIIRCTHGGRPLEIAVSESTLTGLRSWLESVPPVVNPGGGHHSRDAAGRRRD